MSSRFVETDSLCIFDDVLLPWERVFVYRDVELTQPVFLTPAHIFGNTRAQVGLAVKMQFFARVGRKVAAMSSTDTTPQTIDLLGELANREYVGEEICQLGSQ